MCVGVYVCVLDVSIQLVLSTYFLKVFVWQNDKFPIDVL